MPENRQIRGTAQAYSRRAVGEEVSTPTPSGTNENVRNLQSRKKRITKNPVLKPLVPTPSNKSTTTFEETPIHLEEEGKPKRKTGDAWEELPWGEHSYAP